MCESDSQGETYCICPQSCPDVSENLFILFIIVNVNKLLDSSVLFKKKKCYVPLLYFLFFFF